MCEDYIWPPGLSAFVEPLVVATYIVIPIHSARYLQLSWFGIRLPVISSTSIASPCDMVHYPQRSEPCIIHIVYTSAGPEAHRGTQHGIAATELAMPTAVQGTGKILTDAV